MDVLLYCKQGKECVVHIRKLMTTIMDTLSDLNPNDMEEKVILQESLTDIHKEFQYLRIFYDICEANAPKFTDSENLVAFADKMPTKEPTGEAYAEACMERDALKEEVAEKNQQLAEVIKHMRNTIFTINCMLAHVNAGDEERSKKEKDLMNFFH